MKYSLTEDALRKLICCFKDKINNHKHKVVDVEDLDILTDDEIDNVCTFEAGMEGGIIPIASKYNIGCVMVGDGLNVRDNGTLWTEHNVYEAMTNAEINNICK